MAETILSNVVAIKKYFGKEKPITMGELKDLSSEERQELGELCREELK